MFYKGNKPKVAMPENFTIKKVKTKEEMKTFVKIFNQTYGGATPKEPYGTLPPEYSEALFESFEQKQGSKTVIHYFGLLDNEPISITTLIHICDYGCIYNVGTVPAKRTKGIGSALTLNCVSEAMKDGVKIIFLQTEKGSYNERFFSKLGFSPKFVGEGFVKK